jgi:formylglycine-generating enzyme
VGVLDSLLQAIVDDPLAEDRWLVLADWLEEHDDPRRAELLRLHRRLLATCYAPEEHHEREAWQARVVELLAQGVRPCVPQRTVKLGEGVALTFSFVPPGTFLMGSPEDEEGRGADETLHRVTLTRGFWLGVCPVTQAQWAAVVGSYPSRFRGDGLPVEMVSWRNCQRFCQDLSRGFWMGRRRFLCRLPTEAEWEWACRAGTTTPFFVGRTLGAHQANNGLHGTPGNPARGVSYSSPRRPTPVGTFPPNAWGLYDLHGSVWEWCQDRFGPYPHGGVQDPTGPPDGPESVRRGGSRAYHPGACRSACRFRAQPGMRFDDTGCRVVLDPGGG